MYKLVFTPHGKKDIEKLPKEIQSRILKKLTFFSAQVDPLVFSTPLIKLPPTTHRFRVGDYRIAFFVSENTIFVERVRHSREVYIS